MSIDDMILSKDLCSSLYENVIVHTEVQPVHISFEGRNQKKVLVAVDKKGNLVKAEKDMLLKLLSACQLTMDDIAMVNMNSTEMSIDQIVESLKIRHAVLFGVSDLSLGFNSEDAEAKLFVWRSCTMVKSAPIGELLNNDSKKRALWTALKMMFHL